MPVSLFHQASDPVPVNSIRSEFSTDHIQDHGQAPVTSGMHVYRNIYRLDEPPFHAAARTEKCRYVFFPPYYLILFQRMLSGSLHRQRKDYPSGYFFLDPISLLTLSEWRPFALREAMILRPFFEAMR